MSAFFAGVFACSLAGTAAAMCPTPTGSNTPPDLPAGVPDRDLEVVLMVDLDGCGRPRNIEVAWPSGFPAFDGAAVHAIRTWHFSQRDTFVRVPVIYQGAGGSPAQPEPPTDFASVVAAVCRTRFDPVPPGADGTVPGFIADATPIGYGSVDEAVAMLQREARRDPDKRPDARVYQLGSVLEPSQWLVFKGGFVFAPSLMRLRRVHDEHGMFWVTAGMCGAKDPAACAKFEEFMRQSQARPQLYIDGYPPMPEGATCPAGSEQAASD